MNIIDSNHLELRGKSEIAKHFKGHVQLDLCDPLTGRVKERVEGENTFTNALESAINECPYGLSNGAFGTPTLSGNAQTITPLPSMGLGGALLFPSFTNPDDIDDLYEPLSNLPTAYSTVLNKILDDGKLGVFNEQESGYIEENNKVVGYKFVHDWLTSTGNGTIGAIALSHRYCNYYFNNHAYYSVAGAGGAGYYRNTSTNGTVDRVTATHWASNNQSTNVVTVYKMAFNNLPLVFNYSAMLPEKVFEIKAEAKVAIALDNEYLYTIQTSGGTVASIIVKKYDLSDGSLVSTDTLAVSATSSLIATTGGAGGELYDIKDGYLYGICGSYKWDGGRVYINAIVKVQLSNSANIVQLNLPNQITGGGSFAFVGHDSQNVYVSAYLSYHSTGGTVLIDDADTMVISGAGGDYMYPMCILGESGVWRIMQSYQSKNYGIGASIFAPYLATKYVLDSPVTKTADKTMKLSYTVIQV